jgi:hypothetical protein
VSVREGHALWTLAEMASPQRINAHAVWWGYGSVGVTLFLE